MKYEKTQKGNPHQLTVKQHCFPVRSIKRFARSDGRVDVQRVKDKDVENFQVRPNNPLFCARRSWDQRAESGFMKKIEDVYQELADRIVDGTVLKLSKADQAKIADMYALWNIRWIWSRQPVEDQRIEGAIGVKHELSLDDQELLEKEGISVIRPDLTISGRHFTGIHIQKNLFKVRKQMQNAHWGILKSTKGEFVVPDNSPISHMLPIAPQICLFSVSEDDEINEAEVAQINTQSIHGSTEYYFARDLSKCPRE